MLSNRQLTTPLLLQGGRATRLHRIGLDELFRSEEWLQEMLYAHPGLLPVDEVEPAFEGLLPVARELSTASGPLDLMYVNPKGFLTLVETKLWRNPEARRKVVAQLIDYAQDISRWTYDDLVRAVRDATGATGDPLVDLARAA